MTVWLTHISIPIQSALTADADVDVDADSEDEWQIADEMGAGK